MKTSDYILLTYKDDDRAGTKQNYIKIDYDTCMKKNIELLENYNFDINLGDIFEIKIIKSMSDKDVNDDKDKNDIKTFIYTKLKDLKTIGDIHVISHDFKKRTFNFYTIYTRLHQKHKKVQLSEFTNDIAQYNLLPNKFNNLVSKVTDYSINKIILHYNDNDLYILEQESGSCSWFSLYWSILLYYVINQNKMDYIKIIEDITISKYNLLNTIFTKDNFQIEFIDENTRFVLMKSFYLKFCNIKLLNYKLLNEISDIIYDTDINIQINKQELIINNCQELPNDFIKDYEINNNKYTNDFDKLYTQITNIDKKLNINDIIINIIENFNYQPGYLSKRTFNDKIYVDNYEIKVDILIAQNSYCIFFWNMFNKLKEKNINLFNKKPIPEFIKKENIQKFFEQELNTIHIDKLKNFEGDTETFNSLIMKIEKINTIITKYNELIELGNKQKCPSCVINYYYYIKYMNNISKKCKKNHYMDINSLINEITFFIEKFQLLLVLICLIGDIYHEMYLDMKSTLTSSEHKLIFEGILQIIKNKFQKDIISHICEYIDIRLDNIIKFYETTPNVIFKNVIRFNPSMFLKINFLEYYSYYDTPTLMDLVYSNIEYSSYNITKLNEITEYAFYI